MFPVSQLKVELMNDIPPSSLLFSFLKFKGLSTAWYVALAIFRACSARKHCLLSWIKASACSLIGQEQISQYRTSYPEETPQVCFQQSPEWWRHKQQRQHNTTQHPLSDASKKDSR